jgi:hypothetical protein
LVFSVIHSDFLYRVVAVIVSAICAVRRTVFVVAVVEVHGVLRRGSGRRKRRRLLMPVEASRRPGASCPNNGRGDTQR